MHTTTDLCRSVHEALCKLPVYTNPRDVQFSDGLYFFYERGETSTHAPNGRVVSRWQSSAETRPARPAPHRALQGKQEFKRV